MLTVVTQETPAFSPKAALAHTTCYFFGTFNPIHLGHLAMAQSARSAFGFEKILFIPAGHPPHRQKDPDLAPAMDRFKMVARAIAPYPYFQVSSVELDRPGPSYTVETLEALCPEVFSSGTHAVPMLMGSDTIATLAGWHRAEALLRGCCFLHAPRLSQDAASDSFVEMRDANGVLLPLAHQALPMPTIGISAQEIRRRVRAGESLDPWVPESVRQYIAWNGLYR